MMSKIVGGTGRGAAGRGWGKHLCGGWWANGATPRVRSRRGTGGQLRVLTRRAYEVGNCSQPYETYLCQVGHVLNENLFFFCKRRRSLVGFVLAPVLVEIYVSRAHPFLLGNLCCTIYFSILNRRSRPDANKAKNHRFGCEQFPTSLFIYTYATLFYFRRHPDRFITRRNERVGERKHSPSMSRNCLGVNPNLRKAFSYASSSCVLQCREWIGQYDAKGKR